MTRNRAFLFFAMLLWWPALPAQTVELSGVKLEQKIVVAGKSLALNGAGIRYKAIFKVYVAGLYLGQKANTLEQLLADPGPKRMHITMLRDIDAGELGKLFSRGMEDNMDRAAFAKLIPGILRMSQIFSDHKKLKAGDSFTLDWVPGRGLAISINGQVLGAPFTEPEFYKAMMAIWLGRAPADWKLKNDLLDIKS